MTMTTSTVAVHHHPPSSITPRLLAQTVAPSEFDVLCSKDKTHSSHPGNRIFRERIESMKEVYRGTKNKQGKMEITKDIVRYLQEKYSTRFLKRDGNGMWVEVTIQAARDKVSHALRFAARKDAKKAGRGVLAQQVNTPSPAAPTPSDGNNTIKVESEAIAAATIPVMTAPQQPTISSATSTIQLPVQPNPEFPSEQPAESAFCGAIPEEHIEHSKWLLALRQG